MNLQIVAAIPDQLDALRRIYLEARRQTFVWLDTSAFSLTDFDEATHGERIAVALFDDVPVGFVSWWEPDYFIHNLYVDAAYTGRGIGTALLACCLASIGRPARLKCLRKNKNALHFYQARGWTIESIGISAADDFFLLVFNGDDQLESKPADTID